MQHVVSRLWTLRPHQIVWTFTLKFTLITTMPFPTSERAEDVHLSSACVGAWSVALP